MNKSLFFGLLRLHVEADRILEPKLSRSIYTLNLLVQCKNIHDLQTEMEKTVNEGIQTQTADIILALTNEFSSKKTESPENADNTVENEIAKQIKASSESSQA